MNEWEPITNMVTIGLWNIDNLRSKMQVMIYTDENKEMVRGMPIGYFDAEGFKSNPDDPDYIYKCVFDAEGLMFFRKEKEYNLSEKLNNIEKKKVIDRTQDEHLSLIKHRYGSVRNYLLSMGEFKDDDLTDKNG